uniref:DNA 5'-3' helicase n=1 Tax=Parastrongyloides trichosuri TaxID=131310 RepID=A0A0N4ZAK0_PARTI
MYKSKIAAGREVNQTSIKAFTDSKKKRAQKRHRISIRVEAEECQDFMFHDVKVKFPGKFTPYQSQRLIIHKNIFSFNRGLNVLIESPTGSGKTIALLSSSLAWLADYNRKGILARNTCLKHMNGSRSESKEKEIKTEDIFEGKDEVGTKNETLSLFKSLSSEIFSPINIPKKRSKSLGVVKKEVVKEKLSRKNSFPTTLDVIEENLSLEKNESGSNSNKITRESTTEEIKCTCLNKVKIYYATRTHKQIAQVVKEFKRLPYGHDTDIKHTILSSRENCCINKVVKNSGKDITGQCKELNSGKSKGLCNYKQKLSKIYTGKPYELRNDLISNDTPVWDLEEIVDFGDATGVCPYYATSSILKIDADLIFCPFNYLIDPVIRRSTKTSFKNAIVILDEAHNVEDVCRSTSSFEFSEKEVILSLNDVFNKIERISSPENYVLHMKAIPDASIRLSEYRDKLNSIFNFFKNFLQWFRSFSVDVLKLPEVSDEQRKVYQTRDIYKTLGEYKLDHYIRNDSALKELSDVFNDLTKDLGETAEANEGKEASKKISEALDHFRPYALTITCLEKFIYFATFMKKSPAAYRLFYSITKSLVELDMFTFNYQHNVRFADTDSLYVSEHQIVDDSLALNVGENSIAGEPYKVIKEKCVVKLNLWCMDPGLCFRDAFHDTLSVVLASGTLAPIDTFTSELGMEFKQIGIGKQIIPKEQIFASIVPAGRHNRQIICTKKELDAVPDNNKSVSVLDELAYLIYDVCTVVEKGVLVFVSNYSFMGSLEKALTNLGLMKKLRQIKHVCKEPRKTSEMDKVLDDYKRAIKHPEKYSSTCTGAIMLAVFRGKISEGIDFPDDMARCVISVGIPFPSIGDPQVNEKKKYNFMHHTKKNLLSGDQWYKIQGYRALNQALGRCLRHRNDWGVILLVDYRFFEMQKNKHPELNKISNWVIENCRSFKNYNELKNGIKQFTRERVIADSNKENSTNNF